MGALAAGLLCMVSQITMGKKEAVKGADRLEAALKTGEELRHRFLKLVIDDAESFNAVMKAFKIPKEQQETRRKAIQEATMKAAEVPLFTLDSSVQTLRLAREVAENGTTNALSDVSTSIAAARAAGEGAASNVLINLETLDDKHYVEKTAKRVTELRNEASMLEKQVRETVASRLQKTP